MLNEHEITCGGCWILFSFHEIILEMVLVVSSDDPFAAWAGGSGKTGRKSVRRTNSSETSS